MEQLETTRGKSVVIPKLVNRYLLLTYSINYGWQTRVNFFTTPESAIQDFFDSQNRYKDEKIKFYKVVEVELEIPFVA